MAVDLELFKKHVRADDFADDDELLQFYLDAAEEYVIAATNRTEDELKTIAGGDGLPKRITQAIYMLAAHWYNQRESVAGVQMSQVPDALPALIKQCRELVKEDDE